MIAAALVGARIEKHSKKENCYERSGHHAHLTRFRNQANRGGEQHDANHLRSDPPEFPLLERFEQPLECSPRSLVALVRGKFPHEEDEYQRQSKAKEHDINSREWRVPPPAGVVAAHAVVGLEPVAGVRVACHPLVVLPVGARAQVAAHEEISHRARDQWKDEVQEEQHGRRRDPHAADHKARASAS